METVCHPETMAKDLCPGERCDGSIRAFGGAGPELCRMGQGDNGLIHPTEEEITGFGPIPANSGL